MTDDLPEPDQGAAQQAREHAARLYHQAAAELDRARLASSAEAFDRSGCRLRFIAADHRGIGIERGSG